jgi:hypothetical protein
MDRIVCLSQTLSDGEDVNPGDNYQPCCSNKQLLDASTLKWPATNTNQYDSFTPHHNA